MKDEGAARQRRQGRAPLGSTSAPWALLAAVGLCAWAFRAEAAWLEGWGGRKTVTVQGDLTSEDLVDFPLLVLSSGDVDVAARARADGGDLAFTLEDGVTRLDAELEAFDAQTGAWRAWVRVPRLAAGRETRLFVYFENPQAPVVSGEAAWRDDFVAVWHMDDDPSSSRCEDGALNAVCDSSRNRRHGVAPDMDAGNLAPGKIGAALRFDGAPSSSSPRRLSWRAAGATGGSPSVPRASLRPRIGSWPDRQARAWTAMAASPGVRRRRSEACTRSSSLPRATPGETSGSCR